MVFALDTTIVIWGVRKRAQPGREDMVPRCIDLIKSLKERLIHKFNASVAEVGSLDHRQQAELGAAIVGNDGAFVESCLDKMVDYIRLDRAASLVDYEVELF